MSQMHECSQVSLVVLHKLITSETMGRKHVFDLPSISYMSSLVSFFNCTQHQAQIWSRNSACTNLCPRHRSDVCMRYFCCSINSLGRNEVSSLTVRLSFSPAVPKASPSLRTSDANDTGNLEVFFCHR